MNHDEHLDRLNKLQSQLFEMEKTLTEGRTDADLIGWPVADAPRLTLWEIVQALTDDLGLWNEINNYGLARWYARSEPGMKLADVQQASFHAVVACVDSREPTSVSEALRIATEILTPGRSAEPI